VTLATLGGKTLGYEVTLDRWATRERITCQENVAASNPKDYRYTATSGDIRTAS
jgi:hypothetical protein